MPAPSSGVELSDVVKTFDSLTLFEGVSLTVGPGEVVAILGSSGVGKTTLLRLITGQAPFGGRIRVSGTDVDSSGRGSTHPDIVFVTQQPNLWDHMSALDNVALVRRLTHREAKSEARKRAKAYLTGLDLEDIGARYPHSLSGGEQQRVALARGFAAERPILLLDEVTSSIDPDRRTIVAQAMLAYARQGRTIIFVTHDTNIARVVDSNPLELTARGLLSAKSPGESPRTIVL